MLEQTNGGDLCGFNTKTKTNSNLVIMFCEFCKGEITCLGEFKKRWFGPFKV
jgi:hypothetical protein